MPALDLNEPGHLLAKLEHECQALLADNGNSYAAINALRDAYHLSEWIWASCLKRDPGLQVAIMGKSGDKRAWFAWVKRQFPDFPVIEELCNGSKHFRPGRLIRANHRAGWDGPIAFWDIPNFGWDDANHYVELNGRRLLSVTALVIVVHAFWRDCLLDFRSWLESGLTNAPPSHIRAKSSSATALDLRRRANDDADL